MSIHVKDRSDVESLKSLNTSAQCFNNGNLQDGFQYFRSAKEGHKGKVYEQIWLDRGRPPGNPSYGEQVFNNTNGLSSNYREKASAVNTYLRAVVESQSSGSDGQCGRTVTKWNSITGRYEETYEFDSDKWGRQMDDLIPKTYDPDYEPKCLAIQAGSVVVVLMGVAACFFGYRIPR